MLVGTVPEMAPVVGLIHSQDGAPATRRAGWGGVAVTRGGGAVGGSGVHRRPLTMTAVVGWSTVTVWVELVALPVELVALTE